MQCYVKTKEHQNILQLHTVHRYVQKWTKPKCIHRIQCGLQVSWHYPPNIFKFSRLYICAFLAKSHGSSLLICSCSNVRSRMQPRSRKQRMEERKNNTTQKLTQKSMDYLLCQTSISIPNIISIWKFPSTRQLCLECTIHGNFSPHIIALLHIKFWTPDNNESKMHLHDFCQTTQHTLFYLLCFMGRLNAMLS